MLRMEAVVSANASPAVLPQVVAQSALLELSALELEEKVKEELDENPALELARETLPPLDYIPVRTRSRSAVGIELPDGYDAWSNLADGYTLKDDLKQQYRAQNPGVNPRIAEFLIEAINDDGYLGIDLHEVVDRLGVSHEHACAALAAIQQLSPAGIGARDLTECLRLQLRALDEHAVPIGVEAVIDNISFLSTANAASQLRALTRLSASQVQHALEFIRDRLCPYPGRAFTAPWGSGARDTQYAYPDVVLAYRSDGELEIQIPQSERLAVRLNAAYRRLDNDLRAASIRTRDESLKETRRLVRQARQFIDNLTRRYQTIHNVMTAVVERQKEFVTDGPAHLQPLSKKEIASEVGMHEATVCRATKDKYVLMPDGRLEPIDIFFDDALPVKNMIKRLVNSEDKGSPLSDRRLQQALQQRGFELARRTVTKYRLQLDIPAASGRRVA